METRLLKIADLNLGSGTQVRTTDPKTVQHYAELLADGTALGPLKVYETPDAGLVLVDGWHRLEAHLMNKQDTVECVVEPGTLEEARYMALGSNKHGRAFTNEEKRANALEMLRHAEWSKQSDRQIARHLGVSQPFVSKLKAELEGRKAPLKTGAKSVQAVSGSPAPAPASDNGYHPTPEHLEPDTEPVSLEEMVAAQRAFEASLPTDLVDAEYAEEPDGGIATLQELSGRPWPEPTLTDRTELREQVLSVAGKYRDALPSVEDYLAEKRGATANALSAEEWEQWQALKPHAKHLRFLVSDLCATCEEPGTSNADPEAVCPDCLGTGSLAHARTLRNFWDLQQRLREVGASTQPTPRPSGAKKVETPTGRKCAYLLTHQ